MARKRSLPSGGEEAVPPEQIRDGILDVAQEEFADRGFAGARIDAIAERTLTSKRMIYYYFVDKETLYQAVLTRAYAGIRAAEAGLRLDLMKPLEALRQLIETTFDYHADHPDFVRLVMDENIRHGAQIPAEALAANSPAIGHLRDIVDRGRRSGEMRADLNPVGLHLMISALSFYPVSNRHTFKANFQLDTAAPASRTILRDTVVEAILRFCRP